MKTPRKDVINIRKLDRIKEIKMEMNKLTNVYGLPQDKLTIEDWNKRPKRKSISQLYTWNKVLQKKIIIERQKRKMLLLELGTLIKKQIKYK